MTHFGRNKSSYASYTLVCNYIYLIFLQAGILLRSTFHKMANSRSAIIYIPDTSDSISFKQENDHINFLSLEETGIHCSIPPLDDGLLDLPEENSDAKILGNRNSHVAYSEESEIFESITAVMTSDISPYLETAECMSFIKNLQWEEEEKFCFQKLKNGQYAIQGTLDAFLLIKNFLQQFILKMKPRRTSILSHAASDPKSSPSIVLNASKTDPTYIQNAFPNPQFMTHCQNPLREDRILAKEAKSIWTCSDTSSQICEDQNRNNSPNYKKCTVKIAESNDKQALMLYKCSKCSVVLNSFGDYQNHIASNHSSKEHLSKPNARRPLTCKLCGMKAESRKEIRLHHRKLHSSKFFCTQCSYSTSVKPHFLRHVKSVHENKRPFICNICQFAFKRADALRQHKIVHYKEASLRQVRCSEKSFSCHICKKMVRSAAYLKEHMLTHSDDRSFLCEVCGASFKTRAVHRGHMKALHSKRKRPFCDVCGKTFFSKFSLTRHMLLHARSNEHIGVITGYSKDEKLPTDLPYSLENKKNIKRSEEIPKANCESFATLVPINLSVGDSPKLEEDNKMVASNTDSSHNFPISFDHQIPYVIESSTDITNEIL